MPDWKQEIRRRLQDLRLEPARESAIVEELADFLDDCYAELIAGGASPAVAEIRTLAELNGSEILERELRRAGGKAGAEPVVLGGNQRGNMLADLRLDLRFGARLLLKHPGFTLLAVITLALGIGASTAILTVVDAALLRGLPYADSDRLFQVWETRRLGEIKQMNASYPDYLDWGRQSDVLEGICGYTGWNGSFTLTGLGDPERIEGARVTASFFSVLGVAPQLGRAFLPGEDEPGAASSVVITHGLWQRRFGSDPQIIGRQLVLDGRGYTVLGVLPRSFQFAPMPRAQLFVPLRPTPMQASRRYMHWLDVIARLKPGVSPEQAQAQMNRAGAQIEQEHPDSHTGAGLKLVPLHEQIIGQVGRLLAVLLGAVGCVLLIACANVASLQLLRASARRQEIAIRLALGATRSRMVRQLLGESLLLVALGAGAGLGLAHWGVGLLIAAIPAAQLDAMPYLQEIGLNWRVLGLTAALSLLTGVLFGLFPAWQSTRLDLQGVLKEGSQAAAGARSQRLRNLLVVSEVALAMVLLIGAGLLIRSTSRLLEAKLGFDPERLLTLQMELPAARYSDEARARGFQEQLLDRIEALPGVTGAASVNWLPLEGGPVDLLQIEGEPIRPPSEAPKTTTRVVSADYFRAMRIALLKGRYFGERDDESAPGVLVINDALAKRLFGERDPIGRRLFFIGGDPKPFEIVGVVDDERVGGLDEEPAAVVYRHYPQNPWTRINLVVRVAGEPGGITAAVREEVQELDPALAIYGAAPLEQLIAERPETFMRSYPALLMSIFAATALILSAVGIYGSISYAVSQRRRELGIRLALGARRSDLFGLVIRHGLRLSGAGIAIGLAAALALAKLMGSFSDLLYGVQATDPLTFASIAVLLLLVALAACYVPARRATRVDPVIALRSE